MLILSRVSAEFHDAAGTVLFTISPESRLTFVEAPDAIAQDPLFQLLLQDGSIQANLTPVEQRELAADPTQGSDASGKAIQTAVAMDPADKAEPAAAEKTTKTPRTPRTVKTGDVE